MVGLINKGDKEFELCLESRENQKITASISYLNNLNLVYVREYDQNTHGTGN